jgi:hypothetical protein
MNISDLFQVFKGDISMFSQQSFTTGKKSGSSKNDALFQIHNNQRVPTVWLIDVINL